MRLNVKKSVSKEKKWSSRLCCFLEDIGIWLFKALVSCFLKELVVKAVEYLFKHLDDLQIFFT